MKKLEYLSFDTNNQIVQLYYPMRIDIIKYIFKCRTVEYLIYANREIEVLL